MSRSSRKIPHPRKIPALREKLSKPAAEPGLMEVTMGCNLRVEYNGNQEAIVEGSSGILEYNSNVIRLNTPRYILKFSGRNLQVCCMTQDSVIVRGFILSMEFMN